MDEIFAHIGWIDIVTLVIVGWGFVSGWRHGLGTELGRLLCVIVATVVPLHYYVPVSALISIYSIIPSLAAELLAFTLLVLASGGLTFFVLLVLGRIAQLKFVAPVEQVGGMVSGSFRFYLLLSLVVAFLRLIPGPFLKTGLIGRSLLWPYLSRTSQWLHDLLSPWLR